MLVDRVRISLSRNLNPAGKPSPRPHPIVRIEGVRSFTHLILYGLLLMLLSIPVDRQTRQCR